MWGGYVKSEIEKATKGAKTDKQAEQKVHMVLRRLLDSDWSDHPNAQKEEVSESRELPPIKPKTSFRDPASVIRSGE